MKLFAKLTKSEVHGRRDHRKEAHASRNDRNRKQGGRK